MWISELEKIYILNALIAKNLIWGTFFTNIFSLRKRLGERFYQKNKIHWNIHNTNGFNKKNADT